MLSVEKAMVQKIEQRLINLEPGESSIIVLPSEWPLKQRPSAFYFRSRPIWKNLGIKVSVRQMIAHKGWVFSKVTNKNKSL